jgi:GTP cyclohydrolase II
LQAFGLQINRTLLMGNTRLMTTFSSAFELPGIHSDEAASLMRVDRAVTELRQGRLLVLLPQKVDEPVLLVAAIETLGQAQWTQWQAGGLRWRILLTTERLHALGWSQASTPRSMQLPDGISWSQLQVLAAVESSVEPLVLLSDAQSTSSVAEAALSLAKRAQLTPALLVAHGPTSRSDLPASPWLSVEETDVAQALGQSEPQLQRVSDAHVPLSVADHSTLVLFREMNSSAEHVAILFGEPDVNEPVAVRLHSSCMTGDLWGSLRCDCGPQLQRAMGYLAGSSGILLYLSQEGRGTGLANKLRAYRLQDAGLDTIDADHHLGFRGDERDFRIAVSMLHSLGVARVKLLTNNPKKIQALRAGGIEVVERLALYLPTNAHNRRYIQTKRDRAGHLDADDEFSANK